MGLDEGMIHEIVVDRDDDLNDDNIQHLRDICDVDNNLRDSDDEEEGRETDEDEDDEHYLQLQVDNDCYQQDFELVHMMEEVKNWSWDMKKSARIESIVKLLRCASFHLKNIRSKSYELIDTARREFFEAKGIAFRHAEIIGATVVGASRRLEAIRAAEPFAIVVEEACEVLNVIMLIASLRACT